MTQNFNISHSIKELAMQLGFDAIGICKAEEINKGQQLNLNSWLEKGYYADMEYLSRNVDKRINPTLLVDNAKSIVCVALNYYPAQTQSESAPQFAYYAYGKDYHDVMKAKLKQLFDYIKTLCPNVSGRYFVDTAPVLERYWAAQAGLGFIGKNGLLIIPQKGSYFFLGELILDMELEYDKPLKLSCGTCERCLNACPTNALISPYVMNAKKCISYQTIENRNEIDPRIVPQLNNYIYGCDICQGCCPWNKFALPNQTVEFQPSEEFLSLTYEKIEEMDEDDYRRIFKGLAVKRAKYSGLKRNLAALKK